ncbi:hypothetical protein [Paraflavitalea speifideaquila]|uniref:hypothetical protein n=1 Tax=Paraflavitalea speifideaquila TaxID=3076558 RepID=UPI0028E56CE6|nr:hypothetical protein [Paraflavitalea speifideiaquila]
MFNPYYIFLIPMLWLAGGQHQEIAQGAQSLDLGCKSYYHKTLKKTVYTQVEIEAQFDGGPGSWQRFLTKNLRIPQALIDSDDIQSYIGLQFIVDEDGQIINPGIQHKSDTASFTPLEKEAVRFAKLMPIWKPAFARERRWLQKENSLFFFASSVQNKIKADSTSIYSFTASSIAFNKDFG